MIFQLLRKSGGSGSVVGLLYLLMVSLFSYTVFARSYLIKEIHSMSSEQWKGHFLWLEAMYYARNEIYDETCWDLEEIRDEYEVLVDFNKSMKEVSVRVLYDDIVREENFFYDFDCHCLLREKKKDDFVE